MTSPNLTEGEQKRVLVAVEKIATARRAMVRTSERLVSGHGDREAHRAASDDCADAWAELRLVVRRVTSRAIARERTP